MQVNPEILNNLNKFLCKAEALAAILEIADLETVATHVIDNYLWALSDYIREARQLYNRLVVA